MMKSLILVLFLFNFSHSLVVDTKLGPVKGTLGKSRDGKEYYKFMGIPYAKPPIGKLRLQNPEPVEPWKKEKDCTKLPEVCIQIPFFTSLDWNNTIGTEDCLYLNVFTPNVKPQKLLPVLIYIHGGGFRSGLPGGENSADYIIDENTILVNLQYRLGPLGFLSTEDKIISGNFGLKDQSMALKWVKNHIQNFGGDPELITIFGESAGGASTNYQMIAPANKGILKGVISESGTINEFWALEKQGQARPKAIKVAQLLECEFKNSKDILKCLQTKNAEDIIRTELDFIFWQFDPAVVFLPIVEPKWEGAFIDDDPFNYHSTLPWLTGITSMEGLLREAYLEKQDPSVVDDFIRNIDTYLPRTMFLDDTSAKVKKSMEPIKKRYFSDLNDKKMVKRGLNLLLTECFFEYSMEKALKSHKGLKYLYMFGYKSGNSLMDHVSGGTEYDGVSHADELLMLFNWTDYFPKVKKGDEQMSRKMVKYWANFARFQNPTPDGSWKSTSERDYLYIDEKEEMRTNLGQESIDFYSNLPLFKTKDRTEL